MFLSWHFFDMRLPHKTVAKGIDVEIRRRTSTFEPPHSYRLADVDSTISEIAAHVTAISALLGNGTALPGPDALESWNDLRLALPAGMALYFQVKRSAFAQAFGTFGRLWSSR